MAKEKAAGKPGRKPSAGEKKQFLSTMDPLVIRDIKVAAAELEKNASQILEMAAKEWLERYRNDKK